MENNEYYNGIFLYVYDKNNLIACTYKFDYKKKKHNFYCINLENERNKGIFIPYDFTDIKFIYINCMNEEDIDIITNNIYIIVFVGHTH